MDAGRPDRVAGDFSPPPPASETGSKPQAASKNIPLWMNPYTEGKSLGDRSITSFQELGGLIRQRMAEVSNHAGTLRSMAGLVTNHYYANLAFAHLEPLTARLHELEVDLKRYCVQLAGRPPALKVLNTGSQTAIEIEPPNTARPSGYIYQWEKTRRLGAERTLKKMQLTLDSLRKELRATPFDQRRLDSALKDLGTEGETLQRQVKGLQDAAAMAAGAARQPVTPELVQERLEALPETSRESWNLLSRGFSLLATVAGGGASAVSFVGKGVFDCAVDFVGTAIWSVQEAVDIVIGAIIWAITPDPFESDEDSEEISVPRFMHAESGSDQFLRPDEGTAVRDRALEDDSSLEERAVTPPPVLPPTDEESVSTFDQTVSDSVNIPVSETVPIPDSNGSGQVPDFRPSYTAPQVSPLRQPVAPAPELLIEPLIQSNVPAFKPQGTRFKIPLLPTVARSLENKDRAEPSVQPSWDDLKDEFDPLHNKQLREAMDASPAALRLATANQDVQAKASFCELVSAAEAMWLPEPQTTVEQKRTAPSVVVTGSLETHLMETVANRPDDLATCIVEAFRTGRELHDFELRRLPRLKPLLTGLQYQTLSSVIWSEKQKFIAQDAAGHAEAYMAVCFQGKVRPDPVEPGNLIDTGRYVGRIRNALDTESVKLQAELIEAKERSRLSEGRDYQAEVQKRVLEEKLEWIKPRLEDQFLNENMHYFSGLISEKEVNDELAILSARMQTLSSCVPADGDLESLEDYCSECLFQMGKLKNDLVCLKDTGWLIESDSPGFRALEKARTQHRELKQLIHQAYGKRISSDLPACRQRMLKTLRNLQVELSRELPGSSRLPDIQKAIAILQKPKSGWDGYQWMELNRLLNLESSLLKQDLFRDYATVRDRAEKVSVKPLNIIKGQQLLLHALDSAELNKRLEPMLTDLRSKDPEQWHLLAGSGGFPELVKMMQGDAVNMIKLRNELSNSLSWRKKWLEAHCWPGGQATQQHRLLIRLLSHLANPGYEQFKLLKSWPAQHRYPLFKAVVETMAEEKEGQKACNPFVAELMTKFRDDLPLEGLEFDSLCKYAVNAVGRYLTVEHQEEMMRCFVQIKEEIKRRTSDSSLFLIDGLDVP